MKKIVVENIKDLFQIYFVLQEDNIFMDSKYIFVLYEGWFDANIFLKAIFYANIFYAEGEKKKRKRIFNVIFIPNLRVIFFYKYKSSMMKYERVEKTRV